MIACAVFVFAFVSLSVAGVRAIDALEAARVRRIAERRDYALRRHRLAYVGPVYNRHGREVA